jgi:pyrophosphatase PpaX
MCGRKTTAIIFDVDGVLIDSNHVIFAAYQETAVNVGLRPPSSSEVAERMGRPLVEIVRELWPNADSEAYVQEFRRLFFNRSLHIPQIEGATEIVNKIKDAGLKTGIISGKILFFIRRHLDEAGFNLNWFDAIVSYETTEKHKPSPEPLLHILKKLDVKHEESIYVGDAISDYECAKAAEVEFVAVLTGSLKSEDLEKLGVKNIIRSVAELPLFLGL